MRFKKKQLEALRDMTACPRTPSAHQPVVAALRETVRNYIGHNPQFTPMAEEQIKLLLVDRMNRMEMDRMIQCGRIIAVWRNNRERHISFDVEITPIATPERLVINFTVAA